MNRAVSKSATALSAVIVLAAAGGGCGRGDDRAGDREGMVRIADDGDEFYIDRYEFPNREGEIPEHETTLRGAAESCAAGGKRLCTDAEWRRACAGTDGTRRFGYGENFERGRCFAGVPPSSGHSGMPNESEVVAAAGAYERCVTPEGVHDMIGNVEEWVLSTWQGGEGALEGGASFTTSWYATCDGRYSRQPHYRLDTNEPIFSAGFRCCWSPGAPTEADLTADDLAADTRERMETARATASPLDYRPEDEVEVSPGLFVDRFEYPNRRGEGPLVGISWTQAVERCTAAGKRLCSVAEWERACGGATGRPLPYGEEFRAGVCPVQVGDPLPAGAFGRCRTPEGVADMVGGVWEWTDSEMARLDGLFVADASLREVRGGSWFADLGDGVCQPHLGYTAAGQDAVFPDLGFRCCRGALAPSDQLVGSSNVTCPADMAPVGEGCIDRYEHPNIAGSRPTRQLDLGAASAACISAGKHLCLESEWTAACTGDGSRRWPYGSTLDPDACNLIKGLADTGDRLAASGSYPACTTPQGVYDLSGNLWEWVSTGPQSGVLLGGSWVATAGFGACAARAHAAAGYDTSQTGARCCATAAEAERLLSTSP